MGEGESGSACIFGVGAIFETFHISVKNAVVLASKPDELDALSAFNRQLPASPVSLAEMTPERHRPIFPSKDYLMTIARSPFFLAVALAFFASSISSTSLFAHEGHDHGDMAKAEKKITASLASLSPQDQKLAAAQRFCPIMTYDRLGAMGAPIKVMVDGKPVFVCCKGCVDDAVKGGAKTLKTVMKLKSSTETLAKIPMKERMAIEAQKYCAIANTSFLGSMGAPIKLEIEGKSVYLCCGGCTKKAKANPAATLATAVKLTSAGKHKGHGHKNGDHKH